MGFELLVNITEIFVFILKILVTIRSETSTAEISLKMANAIMRIVKYGNFVLASNDLFIYIFFVSENNY